MGIHCVGRVRWVWGRYRVPGGTLYLFGVVGVHVVHPFHALVWILSARVPDYRHPGSERVVLGGRGPVLLCWWVPCHPG